MNPSTLPVYYVNAFTEELFKGNPAAIVILDEWLPDELLIAIAAEINLSETAFMVGMHIRWFTPRLEVNLCGHATLAAAFILHKFNLNTQQPLIFQSKSGELIVTKTDNGFELNFPLLPCAPAPASLTETISTILDTQVDSIWLAADRYVCFLPSAQTVADCSPDLHRMAQLPLAGLCITALTDDPTIDFVSRYFAPAKGVNEDPVTGTAHCAIAPLWAKQLNKNPLIGHQISQRGGIIGCEINKDRVLLSGQATLFLTGHIHLDKFSKIK